MQTHSANHIWATKSTWSPSRLWTFDPFSTGHRPRMDCKVHISHFFTAVSENRETPSDEKVKRSQACQDLLDSRWGERWCVSAPSRLAETCKDFDLTAASPGCRVISALMGNRRPRWRAQSRGRKQRGHRATVKMGQVKLGKLRQSFTRLEDGDPRVLWCEWGDNL